MRPLTNASFPKWVRPIRATQALLLMVPFLSACGLALVSSPPLGWRDAQNLDAIVLTPPCTNSKALVVLDIMLGSMYLLASIGMLAEGDARSDLQKSSESGEYHRPPYGLALGGLLGGVGLGFEGKGVEEF